MSDTSCTFVRAIVLRQGKLLAAEEHAHDGSVAYRLPGGMQEKCEALPDALKRISMERFGIALGVGALRFICEYIGKNHAWCERDAETHDIEYYFICALGSGGDLSFQEKDKASSLAWLHLSRLEEYDLFPRHLASHITRDGNLIGRIYLGDVW